MSFLPPHGDPADPAGSRPEEHPVTSDEDQDWDPFEDDDVAYTYRAGEPRSRADHKRAQREELRRRRGPDEPTGTLRRALGLTTLGTLVPGAGLTMTRRRWIGIPLLLLALVGLALGAWYVVRTGALESALDLATRPQLLRTLGAVAVGAGAVWIGSIVLTAVTARPRRMSRGQRTGLAAFTGLMCLLVAFPIGLGLYYIGAHTDAVDRIFTGREGGRDLVGDADAGPRVGEEDPWAHVDRVNVLLLGSDAGDNREGVRTDSMMIASIDTTSGDTVLFGIPRNLQNVPIPRSNPLFNVYPQGYDCGAECLINGIWTEAEALAEEHPEWYTDDPTPGKTATREVLAAVIGQPIHYTVIVNLEGFEGLINAMGGVDINVQERVPIGGRNYTDAQGRSGLIPGTESGWLEVGNQHLNGREALWYARSRSTTDDFSRMRRQRCVVAAVVQQVNPMTMLQRYPAIAEVAGDNVSVDIAQDELPAWADLVLRVQKGTIQSLPFTINNTDVTDPDFAAMRMQVYKAIHPELTTATATPTQDAGSGTDGPTTDEETSEPTTSTTDDDSATSSVPADDELSDVGTVC
jgi:polyisoprenyl-teichoic acid--peptidoglycan teichoic acid transferase